MAAWLIVIIIACLVVLVAVLAIALFGLGTQRRDRRHVFVRRARRDETPTEPPQSPSAGSPGGGSPTA